MMKHDPFMTDDAIDASESLLETAQQRIEEARARLAVSRERAAAGKNDVETTSKYLQTLREARKA